MLSSGDTIGPYTIRERAGQGGMAIVYKAWHNGLHRLEALKVPRGAGQALPDSAYIQRLLAEARVAAGLHHPHIVGIHGVSEPLAPIPYFAMDWVEGRDLSQILAQKGAFSLRETTQILEKVALALDYAHSRGVVHRDIKPANILLSEEGDLLMPKVVDFGISRAAEDDDYAGETKLTRSGMIVGTPEYMSPEQAGSGEKVDFRTDIYSLGIVAYEMLCGAPPFTAGSGVSRLSILISQVRDIAPLWEKFPAFPPVAGAAILRALAKTPAERPTSCTEFIAELQAALAPDGADWALASEPINGPGGTINQPENQKTGNEAAHNSVDCNPNDGLNGEVEGERTPFDAARFERDESATIFERPISLSDTPPPGPAPTLLPRSPGAETALETPKENLNGAGFSLRARLEAAKSDATKSDAAFTSSAVAGAQMATKREGASLIAVDRENADFSAEDKASDAPEAATAATQKVAAFPPAMAASKPSSLEASALRTSRLETPRSASRVGIIAGVGGVLVGGALVLALMGRGSKSASIAKNNAPTRSSGARPELKNALALPSPSEKSSAPPENTLAQKTAPGAPVSVAAPPVTGARLRIVKVVRISSLAFPISTQRSSRRLRGTQTIVQRGQAGALQTTLQISYQGEREVARRALSRVVTRQPTAQIVLVGTRPLELRATPPLVRPFAPRSSALLETAPSRIRVARPKAPRVSSGFSFRTRKAVKPPPAHPFARPAARPISKVHAVKARVSNRPHVVREAPLPP